MEPQPTKVTNTEVVWWIKTLTFDDEPLIVKIRGKRRTIHSVQIRGTQGGICSDPTAVSLWGQTENKPITFKQYVWHLAPKKLRKYLNTFL